MISILMNRILAVLVLFLAFSLKCNARSESKPKANYPYLLYLPEEYSASTTDFPLIIYLEVV